MYKRLIELELQVSYEWALNGNTERALLHVDYAKQYLLELAKAQEDANKSEQTLKNGEMRYYKNKNNGRAIGTDAELSDEWEEISKEQYVKIVRAGS